MGNKPTTGLASFNIKKSAQEHRANPRWVTSYLRTQEVNDPISTDQPGILEPIQIPGLNPSKRYGPFQKRYTDSYFSWSDPLFVPPESLTVQGPKGPSTIPIVCRCRDIPIFMRDNKGNLILNNMLQELTDNRDIGCWDDTPQFLNPQKWSFESNPYSLDAEGKDTFFVVSNHHMFRQEMVTDNLVRNAFTFLRRKRTRTGKERARKHTRKTRA
jgi:hypothetical protein